MEKGKKLSKQEIIAFVISHKKLFRLVQFLLFLLIVIFPDICGFHFVSDIALAQIAGILFVVYTQVWWEKKTFAKKDLN